VHVPYRGSAPALNDTVAGTVQMMLDQLPSALPQMRSGRVRAVGITTDAPQTAWPGVPPLPGLRLSTFSVLVAPGGTHHLIVAQLNDAGRRFMARPEERARILAEGGVPLDLGPSEIRNFLRREIVHWRGLLRGFDLDREARPWTQ